MSRRTITRPVVGLVVGLVMLLALAACRSGTTAAPDGVDTSRDDANAASGQPSGVDEDASGTTGDAADDTTELADEQAPPTPLQAFLDEVHADFSGEPTSDEEFLRDMRRHEELIAACMAEQGFEYTPVPPPDRLATVGDGGALAWTSAEFVAQYGYGVTTMDPDASTRRIDPNEELVAAMPDAQRRAYHEALYGPAEQGPANDDGGVVQPPADGPIVPSGCIHTASVEVWGEWSDEPSVEADFLGLFEEMQHLWERIGSDPRLLAATEEWSGCMAESGFPGLPTPGDAYDAVLERLGELMPDDGDDEPASDRDDDLAGADGGRPLTDLAGIDPTSLQELRSFELAVAAADHTCSMALREVEREVQIDLEQRFLDDHRAELERYRDALSLSADSGR